MTGWIIIHNRNYFELLSLRRYTFDLQDFNKRGKVYEVKLDLPQFIGCDTFRMSGNCEGHSNCHPAILTNIIPLNTISNNERIHTNPRRAQHANHTDTDTNHHAIICYANYMPWIYANSNQYASTVDRRS